MEAPKYQGPGNAEAVQRRALGNWGSLGLGLGIAAAIAITVGLVGAVVAASLLWGALQDGASKLPGGPRYQGTTAAPADPSQSP